MLSEYVEILQASKSSESVLVLKWSRFEDNAVSVRKFGQGRAARDRDIVVERARSRTLELCAKRDE
jgi:hypothetical protein